jgi:hypothetical protein
MFNPKEEDERLYLKEIIDKLEDAYIAIDERVNRVHKEQKTYLYENKTGMDATEKASIKQSVNMQAISVEAEYLLELDETQPVSAARDQGAI